MSTQGTNAFNYCEQAGKDNFKIFVFYDTWIKSKIFTHDAPY